jgi:hypothetical protein
MLKKVRIVQLKNLDILNPTEEEIVALARAQVIAWVGIGGSGFYQKLGLEGPIRFGKDGEFYKVKLNVPTSSNLEPDGPIIVVDKPVPW